MERGASPLSSVSYNLRLSIYRCSPEVFSWDGSSPFTRTPEQSGLGAKDSSPECEGRIGWFFVRFHPKLVKALG